ncbi:hypothetical protein B7494_g1612 [Chlorociboria aeruginascens]|nr:hypothetical protein B7494_g1612 [Chlorociboria aeruginascens]
MAEQQSKADLIAERQANLPLPEDPSTASDWNTADARPLNVGSGGTESDISTGNASTAGLRGPATVESGVRQEGGVDLSSIGRQGKDILERLPKDATK